MSPNQERIADLLDRAGILDDVDEQELRDGLIHDVGLMLDSAKREAETRGAERMREAVLAVVQKADNDSAMYGWIADKVSALPTKVSP